MPGSRRVPESAAFQFRKFQQTIEADDRWTTLGLPLQRAALPAMVRLSWLSRDQLLSYATACNQVAASETPEGRYAAYNPERIALLQQTVDSVPGAEGQLRVTLAQVRLRRSYWATIHRVWTIWAAEADIATNVALDDATQLVGDTYRTAMKLPPLSAYQAETTE